MDRASEVTGLTRSALAKAVKQGRGEAVKIRGCMYLRADRLPSRIGGPGNRDPRPGGYPAKGPRKPPQRQPSLDLDVGGEPGPPTEPTVGPPPTPALQVYTIALHKIGEYKVIAGSEDQARRILMEKLWKSLTTVTAVEPVRPGVL